MNVSKMEIEEDAEEGGFAFARQKLNVEEYEEILALIKNLPENCERSDSVGLERSFERFVYLTDFYQEQPHLLDSTLNEMVQILLNYVKNQLKSMEMDEKSLLLMKESFKYLCHLAKVRKPKAFLRRLPHEVDDLEPVLSILRQNQALNSLNLWEIRYVCLLWLTLLCKLPFSFDLLNQTADTNSSDDVISLKDELFSIGLNIVFGKPDKSRDAACLFLSEFLSRTDIISAKKQPENEFYLKICIDQCQKCLLKNENQISALLLLCQIYQRLDRDHVLQYAEPLFQTIVAPPLANLQKSDDILLRKLTVKLVQRLGLCLLKPQPVDWLYKKTSRNLSSVIAGGDFKGSTDGPESKISQNLVAGPAPQEVSTLNGVTETRISDIVKIEPPPKSIESIIDFLMKALKDKDTIVRWSAAKGIGRITCRLPRFLAKDVVSKLLTFFEHSESDAAWHGACLSLAELGRRGCLLPDQLGAVVTRVTLALTYDQLRATYSIGAHVRDAACYACWSLARAFTCADLTPHVGQLGAVLLTAALFDADLNCRRAASASFQEQVGRLPGIFPHGIDLVIVLDYFAVGNKSRCFKELSVKVAQHPEYRQFIFDHLMAHKLGHWDPEIRQLTSEAFYNLCKLVDSEKVQSLLPQLIDNSLQSDSFLRHGSLLAISQILKALNEMGLNCQNFEQIKQIPEKLLQLGLTSGVGGEITCSSLNHLLQNLMGSENLHNSIEEPVAKIWFSQLCNNLSLTSHVINVEEVQTSASKTLELFCQKFGPILSPDFKLEIVQKFVDSIKNAKLENERTTGSRGLGSCSYLFYDDSDQSDSILTTLIAGANDVKGDHVTWVEARSACLEALSRIMQISLGSKTAVGMDPKRYQSVLGTVLNALDDYTTNAKGDVGVFVRKTAITCLSNLLLAAPDPSFFGHGLSLARLAVCKLLQQCCSKIDTLRRRAVEACRILLLESKNLHNLPNYDQLKSIFGAQVGEIPTDDANIFGKLTQLLESPDYAYHVMLGFISAIGGLSESISQSANEALLAFLNEIHENQVALDYFMQIFVQICQEIQQNKAKKFNTQLIIPLLKTLDIIFSSNYLEEYANEANLHKILGFVSNQCEKTKNQQKINLGITIVCSMLQFWGVHAEICEKALKLALCHLIHVFPIVRMKTAENLYESLLIYGQLDNHSEAVLSMLTETDWANLSIDQLTVVKQEIEDMLNVN